jgi:dTDP-4-amino-4,6-dideoxygalactose transaminase
VSQSQIRLADPAADHEELAGEIEAAVLGVLRSGQYVLGPEVSAFEEDMREYLGGARCLSVSSGSDALLMALMALELEPGDEVITTPFTFFATAGAIHRAGARPVFADIDPESFDLDPVAVEARIGPRTRAILPVHLYGRVADMEALNALAERHGLSVIEDAAQAVGSSLNGEPAGTIGRFGCFSFFPSKNLGAAGEGGLVIVREEADWDVMKSMRTHGETSRYHHQFVGGNFRMDSLQAAVLRVKLGALPRWSERRRANAAHYIERIEAAGLADRIQLPRQGAGEVHNYHQFTIALEDRDAVARQLNERGIFCGVYYPVPLHLQKCFEYLGMSAGDLPHSERAAERVLSLPVGHRIGEEEVERVVSALAEAVG